MLYRTAGLPLRRTPLATLAGTFALAVALALTTSSAGALTSPALVTRAGGGTAYGAGAVSGAILSGNGNVVVYAYNNLDIIAGTNTNTAFNVYAYNRVTNTTRLVSHTYNSLSARANRASSVDGVSQDGNKILIRSAATNLVAPALKGGSGVAHLYLVDMVTNTIDLVDRTPAGADVGASVAPEAGAILSADGNSVTYASRANNLITGFVDRSGGAPNVYRYNAASNFTLLVSHEPGAPRRGANAAAAPSAITPNGSHISVVTSATNLVTGFVDNNGSSIDTFLWNRTTNSNVLVSHRNGSLVQGGNGDASGFVTRSGTRVIMRSTATDHRADFVDNNGAGGDVYDYSVSSGSIFLVSRSASNPAAGANRDVYALDANTTGTAVLLRTSATNLVPGTVDLNGSSATDLFVAGRAPRATTLISHAAGSTVEGANAPTQWASLSADGRMVVFFCACTNLIAGYDTAVVKEQVFAASVDSGAIRLMSGVRGSETRGANSNAAIPIAPPPISTNGSTVMFFSQAGNQVGGFAGATPPAPQIYLNSTGL